MVKLAEKARRNGLLALEEDVAKIDDAYTKKGLQLVVDGTDSDLVRTILESEIDGMAQRHRHERRHCFTTAGGFAPTLGILGTVMGLVHVLENLDDAGRRSARAIAGAFIATLYGVSAAPTCSSCPIGNKLKEMSAAEINHRDDGARGDPLDPGRRQPARARREARDLRAAGQARRRPRRRRAPRSPASPMSERQAA